jgi:hypothetical protein
MTMEQPPKNPCRRCVKRGFTCEYVSVESGDSLASLEGPNLPPSDLQCLGTNSRPPPMPMTSIPSPATPHFRGCDSVAPLPYTGLPIHADSQYLNPDFYSGSLNLPDLNLSWDGSLEPYMEPRYYLPTHLYPFVPPMVNLHVLRDAQANPCPANLWSSQVLPQPATQHVETTAVKNSQIQFFNLNGMAHECGLVKVRIPVTSTRRQLCLPV